MHNKRFQQGKISDFFKHLHFFYRLFSVDTASEDPPKHIDLIAEMFTRKLQKIRIAQTVPWWVRLSCLPSSKWILPDIRLANLTKISVTVFSFSTARLFRSFQSSFGKLIEIFATRSGWVLAFLGIPRSILLYRLFFNPMVLLVFFSAWLGPVDAILTANRTSFSRLAGVHRRPQLPLAARRRICKS